MNIAESLRIALRSLLSNKLRSTLTVLGIVIGVAAVIAMLSIGRGARQAIEGRITAMGSNLLFVRPGALRQEGVSMGMGTAGTLTLEDSNALADPSNVPSALGVAPERGSGGQLVYQGVNTRTRITGVTPDYEPVHDMELADGQFIAQYHVSSQARVVVLGATTASNLFQGESAVDKVVRINNQPFTVVGVLKAKGGSGMGNMDDMALVPVTTLQMRLEAAQRFRGAPGVNSIAIKVANRNMIDQATLEIQTVLRERHRILFDDDFSVQSQQQMLDAATQMTDVLTLFLGGVAAISLIVGGIGIMNIMLVSVTERTREIGIRKAIGARRRDIQLQFLSEAMVLSTLGGLLGIALGIGMASLMGRVQLAGTAVPPVLQMDAILLATCFSLLVGVFFGFYPASRAARLDPIEALHYE